MYIVKLRVFLSKCKFQPINENKIKSGLVQYVVLIIHHAVTVFCISLNLFSLHCGTVACVCPPSRWACVLSVLYLQLFMAAGAVSDICGAGLQPLSSKPWGRAATLTSQHLIPSMAYALPHYSPTLPHHCRTMTVIWRLYYQHVERHRDFLCIFIGNKVSGTKCNIRLLD